MKPGLLEAGVSCGHSVVPEYRVQSSVLISSSTKSKNEACKTRRAPAEWTDGKRGRSLSDGRHRSPKDGLSRKKKKKHLEEGRHFQGSSWTSIVFTDVMLFVRAEQNGLHHTGHRAVDYTWEKSDSECVNHLCFGTVGIPANSFLVPISCEDLKNKRKQRAWYPHRVLWISAEGSGLIEEDKHSGKSRTSEHQHGYLLFSGSLMYYARSLPKNELKGSCRDEGLKIIFSALFLWCSIMQLKKKRHV